MLRIEIPAWEYYDEVKEEFFQVKAQELCLEHSLVSISKWEAIWHKPYLSKTKKTLDELISYIKCMTLTQNVPEISYQGLTKENYDTIADYLTDSMTATWFSKDQGRRSHSREIVTSELIYYWMITLGIPMECQKWHLNRLLTLIQICNIKNSPSKKMSSQAIARQNADINSARRLAMHSKG